MSIIERKSSSWRKRKYTKIHIPNGKSFDEETRFECTDSQWKDVLLVWNNASDSWHYRSTDFDRYNPTETARMLEAY